MTGAGLQEDGRVVSVPSANFLVPKAQVRQGFRSGFREALELLRQQHERPAIDPRIGTETGAVPFSLAMTNPQHLLQRTRQSATDGTHALPAFPHPVKLPAPLRVDAPVREVNNAVRGAL